MHGFKEELDRMVMWLKGAGFGHTLFGVPEGISGNVRRSRSQYAFMPATGRENDDPNYGALPAELAADSPYLLEGGL